MSSKKYQVSKPSTLSPLASSSTSTDRRESIFSRVFDGHDGHNAAAAATTTTITSDDNTNTLPTKVTFLKTFPSGRTVTLDESDVDPEKKRRRSSSRCSIKKIERLEVKKEKTWIPFFSLFRYATPWDCTLMIFGFLITFFATWPIPALNLIYGQFVNTLVHYEATYYRSQNGTHAVPTDFGAQTHGKLPFMDYLCDAHIRQADYDSSTSSYNHDYLLCQVQFLSTSLFFIALWYIFGSYCSVVCFDLAAFNQALAIKKKFFSAVLRQDIEWFDEQTTTFDLRPEVEGEDGQGERKEEGKNKVKSTEFSTRVANDLKRIECGMNENLSLLLYFISSCLWHTSFALYFGWKLALAIFCTSAPIVALSTGLLTKVQSTYVRREMKAYSEAGSIASELFTSIKTVLAFGGETRALEVYDERLAPAVASAGKRSLLNSLGNALSWAGVYFGFAVGVWYGVQLIIEDHQRSGFSIGTIIIVFWCSAAVGWNTGYAAPYYESILTACICAKSIYDTIENEPKIHRKSSQTGFHRHLPPDYKPSIEFRSVHFTYPTRPSVPVLRAFEMALRPGEVVALVGPSGSGKSTVIQLLQRFYDPLMGGVFLDGVDLRDLDVGWLREQFGVVGQEPVLFDASIGDNIRLGATSERLSRVSEEEVESAAREANAHEFILRLPEGYRTMVGERGAQLSGGQKQRIAIARALLKNPKILLLDEATSALDLKSESLVQAALDRASRGRTTIIIAHRLSTISKADRIVCLSSSGTAAETGSHAELMERKGAFYELVTRQVTEVVVGVGEEKEERADSGTHVDEVLSKTGSEELEPLEPGFVEIPLRSVSGSLAKAKPDVAAVPAEPKPPTKYTSTYVVYRIIQMVFQSRLPATLGIICSCLFGLCVPIYSFIFGNFVNVFTNHTEVLDGGQKNGLVTVVSMLEAVTTGSGGGNESNHMTFGLDNGYLKEQSWIYSFQFLALAGFAFVSSFLQITFFSIASQRLVTHLRLLSFNSMITKPITWHEQPQNNTGNLCAHLANDPSDIQGSTGPRIAMFCQATSSLLVAIIFGLYTCWNLSLVALIFVPLIAYSSSARVQVLGEQNTKEKDQNEAAAKTGQEAIVNIRTIASLHKEGFFEKYYATLLEKNISETKRKFHRKSVHLAIAVGCPLVAYASTFLYGGYLIANHQLSTGEFFKVIEAMIFGAVVFGQACFFSSDFAKAKMAAINLFQLIDSTFQTSPSSPSSSSEESTPPVLQMMHRCSGELEFKSVSFSYPNRPSARILNEISFKVEAGEKIALVGQSGSGKSTILQLLERFYETSGGVILLDKMDITKLSLHWLRSQMALVSQEPTLFNTTIRENIAYGDNSRENIPLNEIQEAARKAAIDEFIESLPEKWETKVGVGGCQLSGGQKQRIAIARAWIRNPAILLLDEATSALDSNSEKQIQTTLEQASTGRTCITIAHRLSTIINADKILYLDRGIIVESGSHEQLLALRGHYWALYNQQTTTTTTRSVVAE